MTFFEKKTAVVSRIIGRWRSATGSASLVWW